MDIAFLAAGLIVSAYLVQFVFPDGAAPRSVTSRFVAWRWAFLCATTILAALSFMQVLLSRRIIFKFFDYPYYVGGVLGIVYALTTIFSLVASPFFFRRVRPWAVSSWFLAAFSAFWSLAPVY